MTRVVGIQHEGRRDVLEDLAVGEGVLLVWEQENPYDPKALRVVTQKGKDLGFIRRPIAHKRSRASRPERHCAKVALLLGEQYDVNERVWVRVEVS